MVLTKMLLYLVEGGNKLSRGAWWMLQACSELLLPYQLVRLFLALIQLDVDQEWHTY